MWWTTTAIWAWPQTATRTPGRHRRGGQLPAPEYIACAACTHYRASTGAGPARVRNNSTTHLLDRVAADFGEKCYEVNVGFKFISAKMAETNAVVGGESSGGMAVRGHIAGKDGIYAAALLVEMLAVTRKERFRALQGDHRPSTECSIMRMRPSP